MFVGATAAGGGGTGCSVAFCSLELSGFIIVFLDSFSSDRIRIILGNNKIDQVFVLLSSVSFLR